MSFSVRVALAALLLGSVACSEQGSNEQSSIVDKNEEVANPAAVRCEEEGNRVEGDDCVFKDGSRCEQWAYYRGECSPGGESSCSPLAHAGEGGANPAASYCAGLGTIEGQDCVFANGERCEQWAFFRGECGQENSFCAGRGGTIENVQEDGEFERSYAVCTLPSGERCVESSLAFQCACNP